MAGNEAMTDDLTATIVSAVQARVEAQVAAALAGDEMMGRYVSSALRQTVEVPNARTYGRDRVPFLNAVLTKAIQEATKRAVEKYLADEVETIEEHVRRALKRDSAKIAAAFVEQLAKTANSTYGVSVKVDLKFPRGDE